ncbi:MAG: HPF/RaiA family ribosome-associated protein [Armatimonadetes bacterium]|nr:HPF/RaiA family ribosome-associated protein [Armatimonadota bacterium]
MRSASGLPDKKDCDHASKRLDQLSRLVRHLDDAEIVYRDDRSGRRVDVVVKAGRSVYRGSGSEPVTRQAIDVALAKIEAQMRRDHGKWTDRAHKGPKREIVAPPVTADSLPVDAGHVVHTKTVSLRPMTLSEATLAFEVSQLPVFPFHNVETSLAEVVYRRENGGLGVMRLR